MQINSFTLWRLKINSTLAYDLPAMALVNEMIDKPVVLMNVSFLNRLLHFIHGCQTSMITFLRKLQILSPNVFYILF